MSAVMRWVKRSALVAAGSAALLVTTSSPSWADGSTSTTGVSGRWAYRRNGDYNLYARDVLSDGHCAQWQRREPGGSWENTINMICSNTEAWAGLGRGGGQIRLCRTGVWNCTRAISLV
jgi:phospholipase/lecithinase/hemolysin